MSNAFYLRIAASIIATLFIGFGINALLNPASALSFFELQYSTISPERKVVDVLLAAYGVRDIFMGLAMYIAAYFGDRRVLGWTTVAAGAVAGADGGICKFMIGRGEWKHWGHGLMEVVLGAVLALG
jgi:hypothetical protein